jgi:hypothetical protein
MVIEIGLPYITEDPKLAEYSKKAIVTIANTKWPDFVVRQSVTLAKTQTAQILTRSYDRMGLCSHFGGEFDPQNEKHIQELHAAFAVVVSNYREILANNSQRANNGSFAPEVGSPSELSELMFNSRWANADQALEVLKNLFSIEEVWSLVHAYLALLISSIQTVQDTVLSVPRFDCCSIFRLLSEMQYTVRCRIIL